MINFKEYREQHKVFFLHANILWIKLWMNNVFHYQGLIVVWSKTLERIYDEKLSSEPIKIKDAAKYIKKHAYGDFSYMTQFPGRPLFMVQLFTIVSDLERYKWRKYFPVDYRVKPVDRTYIFDYKAEKIIYRICHKHASKGLDLNKYYYAEYKCIANKYNWPIIYNSDEGE